MGRSRITKQDIEHKEKEEQYRKKVLRKNGHFNNTKKDKDRFYGYTLDQIENRVQAECNKKRLEEHRQCDYCHLVFDCKYYKSQTNKTLCEYLDSLGGE